MAMAVSVFTCRASGGAGCLWLTASCRGLAVGCISTRCGWQPVCGSPVGRTPISRNIGVNEEEFERMSYDREELRRILQKRRYKCHLCHRRLTLTGYGSDWHVDHSVPR